MSHTNRWSVVAYLVLPYAVILYFSLFIVLWLWYPTGLTREFINWHLKGFSVVFVLWMVVFFIQRLFEIASLRSVAKFWSALSFATIVNLLIAVLYFYFQPGLVLTPRRFLLALLLVNYILMFGWYLLARILFSRLRVETVFVLEEALASREIQEEIKQHEYAGVKFLGSRTISTLSGELSFAQTSVILPSRVSLENSLMESLLKLQRVGLQFYPEHVFYEHLVRRVNVTALSQWWFLENVNYRKRRGYDVIKRVIDIVAGLVALFIFLVTLPLLALLVKLSSPGPVFFRQQRVGQNGAVFTIMKYRTMVVNSGNTWTSPHDERITWVGNILRRLRLDEIPQCWNLLLGNMSLVGPRPEQVHIVEQMRHDIPFYDERHGVKPGLTGWAQLHVYAGNTAETRKKLEYDLYYIKHRGLLFDLEIMLKTIAHVLTGQGQ